MTGDQIDAGFHAYLVAMAIALAVALGITSLRRRHHAYARGDRPRPGLVQQTFASHGLALFGIGWSGVHHVLGVPNPVSLLSLVTVGAGLAIAIGRRLWTGTTRRVATPRAAVRSRVRASRRTM